MKHEKFDPSKKYVFSKEKALRDPIIRYGGEVE